MGRKKKNETKAFVADLHDIMDGAGTMKDTEIAEAFVAKGWRKRSEGEWISVEERLPERMKPVLVLATGRYEEDGYDVLIAYHDGGEWEEQCVHSHECCAFYIYADVKFWMPLPEPPKENTP